MDSVFLPQKELVVLSHIGGEWVKGNGVKFEIDSPYSGKPIGYSYENTVEDIDQAAKLAHEAFKTWSKTPIKERSQVLFKFREILLREIDAISHMVALENGKTIGEAKAGVLKGIEVLEYALSLQNNDIGGKMEVSRGVTCEYRREALGVVASITPFNFPAMVPMWTIPIAIALGNSYIWKPSEKTPLTSLFIANAFKEAGLPNGVFSVVQGGKDVVNGLIDNKLVKAIAFVGSSKIAKLVYERGSNLGKRVLALGGAKNHIILLPDADADMSGIGISDSFTGCAGQRCMAASVLLAVGEVENQIKKIIERAKSLELGKEMGAIITKEQVEFLHKAIGRAEKAGAKILLDGRNAKAPEGYDGGHWLGPTVIDMVTPESEASKEELFGPILSIIRAKNISEAMDIENDNQYGNSCSVFTSSGQLAQEVINRASTGMVGVNIGVPVPREPFSFGGVNDSKFGYGDITGQHSLNFWTNIKKITTKWQMSKDANWMS